MLPLPLLVPVLAPLTVMLMVMLLRLVVLCCAGDWDAVAAGTVGIGIG